MIKAEPISNSSQAKRSFLPSLHGKGLFYWFALPFAILTILMGLWPIGLSILTSFTESYTALSPTPKYIGIANYQKIFTNDLFLQSAWLTLRYTFLAVLLNLVVALAYAVFLNSKYLGRTASFFKLCAFLPVVTPDLAGYIVWKWMLNSDFGSVNALFSALGLPTFYWIASPDLATLSILIAELWYHSGFYVVIFIANLAMLDKSLEEAAIIDGSGFWQRFFHIILPQLRPAIMINSVYALIQFLKTFTVVVIITKGGPSNTTNFVSYYAYQLFDQAQYGEASAMATSLFGVVMVLAFLVYWLNQRGEWQ